MSALEKWGNLDLNQGPTGYESAALTTELLPQENYASWVAVAASFLRFSSRRVQ